MPITINGSGTITGATTLATTVASPTFTTPSIDSAQFATVSGAAPLYACRAWVNFNGTGTVAIRASGNVTSITDNGVGSYTVNFTTAMPDVNYCVSGAANLSVTGADAYPININAYSTSSCAIDHREAGTQTDTNYMNVAFFR
jgi:hypothetical protein